MKCYYCETKLVEDFLGTCCPNEKCKSVDGIIKTEIHSNGSKFCYKNGKLHREDGPAFINRLNGTKMWYKDGKLHRDDGPAAEYSDGRKYWYKNGQLQKYWMNDKKTK